MSTRRLLADGGRVLVAASGGVDSMVLLRVLHSLATGHGWHLTVAHFNHLLRGGDAAADQRLVERAAKKLGVRFESASADVKAFARAQKLSIEMAARRLRHEFLARAARQLGIAHVALAHHADDQAELFLLRLLRGAGSTGLAGMNWAAPSPADAGITLIRPLLGEVKSSLAAFAKEERISFREDKTNAGTGIPRNRIRHKLLPLLRREYQPAIDAVLRREMETLRAESEFITTEARRWLETRAQDFDTLAVALQRRVLQLELHRSGIIADFDLLERLRLNPATWHAVNPEVLCRRTPAGVVETKAAPPANTPSMIRAGDDARSLTLIPGEKSAAPHVVSYGGREFTWSVRRGSALPKRRAASLEYFDAAKIGPEIVLRHWLPGDRFQPIGMSAPVKLQDLFTNRKIPRARRHLLVLATTAGGDIFWVEGLRMGERFKLDATTRRILKWNWRPQPEP